MIINTNRLWYGRLGDDSVGPPVPGAAQAGPPVPGAAQAGPPAPVEVDIGEPEMIVAGGFPSWVLPVVVVGAVWFLASK